MARRQVERGYIAQDRTAADSYVERLQERAGADCPPETATPPSTAPGTAATAAPAPSSTDPCSGTPS